MRITQNQNSRDYFVYSGDDEVIWQQLPRYDLRMKQLPFAAKNAVASGAGDAFLCDGKFTAAVGKASVEIDTAKMQLKGLHNAYNAMAAALATLAAGVAPASIRRSIYGFAPVVPPPRTRPGSQRRTVDQRFEGHQCRLGILCARKHDTPRGMDRRGHGQRQRLRTAQGFRPCEGTYARLHGRGQHQADRSSSRVWCPKWSPPARSTPRWRLPKPCGAVRATPCCCRPPAPRFDLFRNYEQRGELFKKWVEKAIAR